MKHLRIIYFLTIAVSYTGLISNFLILQIHRQICQINESPIIVKLDPFQRQSETVPVKCYESVIDIVEGNATMLLVELTYSLVTEVYHFYLRHLISTLPSLKLLTK